MHLRSSVMHGVVSLCQKLLLLRVCRGVSCRGCKHPLGIGNLRNGP